MALILLLPLLLISAFNAHSSDALWCVCRSDVPEPAIQKTLDYACGAGADCMPIHGKGSCYDPNTVVSHCTYAANSLFQKNGQAPGSCDFSGTTLLSTTDPSYGSCLYPGSVSYPTTTPTTTPTSTQTTTPTSAAGTVGSLPTPTTGAPLTTATPSMPGNFSGGIFGGLDPSAGSSSGITTTDGTGFINAGSFLIYAGKCSAFFGFVLYSIVLF